MEFKGIYSITRSVTTSTAITILQIKAGAATPLKIIRAWCNQSDVATNAQAAIQLLRKTAAATVTSFTPLKNSPSYPTADAAGGTAATGITASAEGTDGDIIIQEGFQMQNGWLYLPVPEERIIVPAAGIIALKFPAAPTSALWKCGIIFGELNV
jgi:hypothetical protein